jgi:hypothetical protein
MGHPTLAEETARRSALARCADLIEDLHLQANRLAALLERPDVDSAFAVATICQLQAACQGIDVAMLSVKARKLRGEHPKLFAASDFPREAP